MASFQNKGQSPHSIPRNNTTKQNPHGSKKMSNSNNNKRPYPSAPAPPPLPPPAPPPAQTFQLGFFKRARQQSKFEQYGPGLMEDLRMLQTSNDGRIHDYQINALFKTRAMIEGDPSNNEPVLIVAPTGSGKSGIIVLLPYVLQSRKVLVLTPSKEITEQLAVAFGQNRNKPSFLEVTMGGGAGMSRKDKEQLRGACEQVQVISHSSQISNHAVGNLVIVNAQKFGGRSGATLSVVYGRQDVVQNVREFFAHFDTLLVDEAHHYPAKTWKDIVDACTDPVDGIKKRIVFLTATPYRMLNGARVPILSRQRVALEVYRKDLERKTIRPSKFTEKDGYRDVRDVSVLAKHVTRILRKNKETEPRIPQHQAMIYVRTKLDAEDLAQKLNKVTRREDFAVPIFTRPSKDRDVAAFNSGLYQVAIVCGSLKEGYDNCNVSCCIILKNMQSRPAFSQFVGRCLRMKRFGGTGEKDQTKAVILSYRCFNQRGLWTEFEKLATTDPVDEESDLDF